MGKATDAMKPIVWNSPKIKDAYNKKYKKGKLTFFKISNPEGDLDFLLSRKMLKYRKQEAKALFKASKKQYKYCRNSLASIGSTKLTSKEIRGMEKDLVTAKMLKIQTKEYYKLAKADYAAYQLRY